MTLLSPEDPIVAAFHARFFASRVHRRTRYRGVPVVKAPTDLWLYQELLHEHDIGTLIELGTLHGGFCYFVAHTFPELRVLGIDAKLHLHPVVHEAARASTLLEFVEANSVSAVAREAILRRLDPNRRAFFLLDSDHHYTHVLAELEMLRSITRAGDYVVVEDSNIGRFGVRPEYGPGPREALLAYEAVYPDDYEHDRAAETKFGLTYAPDTILVRR